MERMDKTREGTYTVSVTHWELLTLHAVVIDWLNDHGGAIHKQESQLESDLLDIIDPDQED